MLKPLQIKCGGAEFATGKVEEGSLLPLKIDFSTFQQNTLLLYADNVDEVCVCVCVCVCVAYIHMFENSQ